MPAAIHQVAGDTGNTNRKIAIALRQGKFSIASGNSGALDYYPAIHGARVIGSILMKRTISRMEIQGSNRIPGLTGPALFVCAFIGSDRVNRTYY